jgi:transcriptional regulator with XRE-family HTH domain
MARMTRAQRADVVREAARIRFEGQRAGRSVDAVAGEIGRRLPLSALECRRLAYGWTRSQLVSAVVDALAARGLADPGLSEARVCRWEHGDTSPSADYAEALAAVFGVAPSRLGLAVPAGADSAWYRRPQPREQGAALSDHTPLTAVTDSVALQLEVEGPAGGPQTRDLVHRALEYYVERYGDYPPAVIGREVHRCRNLVVGMLARDQTEPNRRELRRLGGWLSALVGNFAFSASDYTGAHIHLGTSARLGGDVGDTRLEGWSLGAQSMVAQFQHRDADAYDLALQARELARDDLRKSQAAAWCELRPLARMGRRYEARDAAARAQRHMEAATEDHGRFGFDRAQLHLHLAEAALDLGEAADGRRHATASQDLKATGSGGWAAATAVLARAAAGRRDAVEAVGLGCAVLDAVPADHLRETTRRRLWELHAELSSADPTGPVGELGDRLQALAPHVPPARSSPEINGR